MLLNQLPEDVLLFILQMCSAKDLSSLSQTCVRFEQLTHTDALWKALCRRDYEALANVSNYYHLYSQLLHRHGWMLGLYQCVTEPGGLLKVRYSNGKIEGTHRFNKNDYVGGHLVYNVRMFEIKVGDQLPMCLLESTLSRDKAPYFHRVEIKRVEDVCISFVYTCKDKSYHFRKVSNNRNLLKTITTGY
ncbi:unnamed protein product, partial [Meganyctiphanes norvegica]